MANDGGPLFLHSMWRTGSSYLLSRFGAEPGYLTFYEPFNGEITDTTLRRRAARDHADKHVDLGHPEWEGGYFAVYDSIDPGTGRTLASFSHPSLPLHDVYNGLSKRGAELLVACGRLATARGQRAVFGFCHSGVQIAAIRQRFGGEHIYLSRRARDQFWSYRPLDNDFFIAATALQLLASRQWGAAALVLVPRLSTWRLSWRGASARLMPHRLAMRIGRQIWRSLSADDMYALFFLSWEISNRAGASDCDRVISLLDLSEDEGEIAAFEARFGIRLLDLAPRPAKVDPVPIDYDAIEARAIHALERCAAALSPTPPVPGGSSAAILAAPDLPRPEM